MIGKESGIKDTRSKTGSGIFFYKVKALESFE